MDKLEKLYNTLVADKVDLPDYNQWEASLQTDEGLASLRDQLRAADWDDVPEDVGEFANLIGVEKKNEKEQPSESLSPEEGIESNSLSVEDIQGELEDTESFSPENIQEEIETINTRIQELDEKIKSSGADSLSRSTGMYGIMAADTSESRKLRRERDELLSMRNVLQGDEQAVQKEEWRKEMEERYPISSWDNTKAIIKNTLLGTGTAFLGLAQGVKMPQYYLEKMVDRGTKSLEDKDIIGSETAEFMKQLLSPSTSTTITVNREAKQYAPPTVAEEMSAFAERSVTLKEDMVPTMRMIDAIKYGNPALIAMQAVDAVTNYVPSIAVGATTGGLGFIPMFAGEGFTDAAALKADLTDKELKEFIEDYDADVIVPAIVGGAAGFLERKLLMGLKNFVFSKQMTSGFVNKFKEVVTEGGRQGIINWFEAGLMDMNLKYAETGDIVESTKGIGQYLVSEDGLNALLESFVAGTLMAGGGRAVRPQRYSAPTKQITLKTDMADINFIGREGGEYFMRSDYLMQEQAQEMMDDLQDRYPNMEFSLKDNTNKEHINAPANWTVKAEAKKTPVEQAPAEQAPAEKAPQETSLEQKQAGIDATFEESGLTSPPNVKATEKGFEITRRGREDKTQIESAEQLQEYQESLQTEQSEIEQTLQKREEAKKSDAPYRIFDRTFDTKEQFLAALKEDAQKGLDPRSVLSDDIQSGDVTMAEILEVVNEAGIVETPSTEVASTEELRMRQEANEKIIATTPQLEQYVAPQQAAPVEQAPVEQAPAEKAPQEKVEKVEPVVPKSEKAAPTLKAPEIAEETTRKAVEGKKAELEKQAIEEIDKEVSKKTSETMKDIKKDYEGFVEVDNVRYQVKKVGDELTVNKVRAGEKKEFQKVTNEKIKEQVLDKFFQENEAIVDAAYAEIDAFRQETTQRVEAEQQKALDEYMQERGVTYQEKESPPAAKVPINIEKHKSNLLGEMKKLLPENPTKKQRTEAVDKAIEKVKAEKWFQELSKEDQQLAETTLRDFAEQEGKLAPKTRDVLQTEEPGAKFTTSIGDRVRMEQRAAKGAETYTRNQYHGFVKDLQKDINEAIDSKLIPKAKVSKLSRAVNRAAKIQDKKAQIKALERINDIISEINDPHVKSTFKKLTDRFKRMMEHERIAKIGDGKKVLEGVKTPEFAELIKELNDLVDTERRMKGDFNLETMYNNLMEQLINETDQAKIDKLVDEITRLDMLEVANEVQNLRNIMDAFIDTKPNQQKKRADLLERAIAAMDALGELEAQSNQARLERKAEIERQAEQRREERESTKKAVLSPEELQKRGYVDEFREQVKEDRSGAYDNLINQVNESNLSERVKENLTKKLQAERGKDNHATQDLIAVQDIMKIRAEKGRKVLTPESKRTSVFREIAKRFNNAHYDNLRGLLRQTVRNRDFRKQVMELDKMADDASIRYAERVTDSHTIIDKWHAILNFMPGYQGRGVTKRLKGFVGTKIGNTFYLERNNLGLKTEQLDSEGNPVTDFSKLSYNDLVYLNALLKSEDQVRILEKDYSEQTVADLREHVSNSVSQNEQLSAFSNYLRDVILPDLYKVTNPQYKKRFGTDMPSMENYMRRFAEQERVKLSPGEASSIIPKHVFQRGDPAKLKLKGVDIVKTINEMYEAANKWDAFYETQRRWDGVYGDMSVRNAILENIPNGKAILESMDAIYKAYPDGGDGKYFGWALVVNATMSRIMGNPSLLIKQAVSAPNAISDFNKQMAHRERDGSGWNTLFAEALYFQKMLPDNTWAPFWKEFVNNAVLQERRRHGVEPHMRAFLKSGEIQDFLNWTESTGAARMTLKQKGILLNETLRKASGFFVKTGDIVPFLAIKPNFSLRYEKFIKEGMNPAEASRKAFDRSVNEAFRTQQPAGRAHLLSAFQLSKIGRNIPYITAPIQMGQNLVEGYRDMTSPLSTPSERVAGAKNMAYYGYVQPYLWIWATNFANKAVRYMLTGRTDEDELMSVSREELQEAYEQWEVLDILSTGVLQGRPLHKIVRDNIAYPLQGKPWEASFSPALQMVEDASVTSGVLASKFTEKTYDEFTDYEKYQVARFVGDVVGIGTGHGTPTLVRYRQIYKKEREIRSYWDDYKKNDDIQNFFYHLEKDMEEDGLTLERRDKNKVATEHRAYFQFATDGDRQTKDDIRYLVNMPTLDRKARYLHDRRSDFPDFPSFRSKFMFEYGSPLGHYEDADGKHEVRPLVPIELWERYIENHGE